MIEKIVLFHNPTDEDFTGMWNSVSEVIAAGKSRHMELWRAKHYAKHLIDRELNRRDVKTDNQVERERLYKTIVIDEEVIEVPKDNVASELANIEDDTKETKKSTKGKAKDSTKKETKKSTKASDEETFEGLQE